MKRYIGLFAFLLILVVVCDILGLPQWAGFIILVFIVFPRTRQILFLVLSSLSIITIPLLYFSAIGVHIYTVVVAWQYAWWKGILSLFLPVISQVYWFVVLTIENHSVRNAYCITLLIFVFVWVYTYMITPLLNACSRTAAES